MGGCPGDKWEGKASLDIISPPFGGDGGVLGLPIDFLLIVGPMGSLGTPQGRGGLLMVILRLRLSSR